MCSYKNWWQKPSTTPPNAIQEIWMPSEKEYLFIPGLFPSISSRHCSAASAASYAPRLSADQTGRDSYLFSQLRLRRECCSRSAAAVVACCPTLRRKRMFGPIARPCRQGTTGVDERKLLKRGQNYIFFYHLEGCTTLFPPSASKHKRSLFRVICVFLVASFQCFSYVQWLLPFLGLSCVIFLPLLSPHNV